MAQASIFGTSGVSGAEGSISNGCWCTQRLNNMREFKLMSNHSRPMSITPIVNVGDRTITWLSLTNRTANATGEIFIDINGIQVAAILVDTSGDGYVNTTDYITGLSIPVLDGDKIGVRGDNAPGGGLIDDSIVNFG